MRTSTASAPLLRLAVLACTMLGAFAGVAGAEITSTSANVRVIDVPTPADNSLDSDDLEDETNLLVWFEGLVTSPGDVTVEHYGPGLVDSPSDAVSRTIDPAFTLSYIVHFDQEGSTGSSTITSQSITFERNIVGVIYTAAELGNTDGTFGPAGLTYGGLNFRGFELGSGANDEQIEISGDLRTLTIHQTRTAGTGVDQLRVLVNPEPSTWALMTMGVLGLGVIVRRRRRDAGRTTASPQ